MVWSKNQKMDINWSHYFYGFESVFPHRCMLKVFGVSFMVLSMCGIIYQETEVEVLF